MQSKKFIFSVVLSIIFSVSFYGNVKAFIPNANGGSTGGFYEVDGDNEVKDSYFTLPGPAGQTFGYSASSRVSFNDPGTIKVDICIYGIGGAVACWTPIDTSVPSVQDYFLGYYEDSMPLNDVPGDSLNIHIRVDSSSKYITQTQISAFGRYVVAGNLGQSDNAITAGQSVTLYFNAYNGIDGVMYDDTHGLTYSVGPRPAWLTFPTETTSYHFSAYGPDRYGGRWDNSNEVTVVVNPNNPPPGAFGLNQPGIDCNQDPNNTTVNLSWGASSNATSYTINGNYGIPGGSGITGTSFQYHERKGVGLSYSVTANNAYGSYTSNTVYANACPVPVASMYASPTTVDYNQSSTLVWSSSNAYVCNASWGGGQPLSGSRSTGNLTSSQGYSITCSDPDGGYASTATANVTVNQPPPPSVSISADAGTVGYGGSTTVRWSSSNASGCSVSPGGGSGISGSQGTGALTSSTTYTVTCTGLPPNGSVSSSVTVNVSVPSVSISANPSTLPWNNSGSTITWSASDAASCTASGNWSGTKATSGTFSTGILAPGQTYAYTLTCSGSGSGQGTTTVTVAAPIPSAYSVTYSPPDYCTSGPGGYVAWSYSDPSGSTQTAYDVQISILGNFNSPTYDSGKLNSGSHVFAIPNGVLQFGTGYKARVMVWNTYNSPSSWSSPTSTFNTPNYAYPQVNPPYQFTWTPSRPQQNQSVPFTDHTVFGGNANNRSWSWTFGDGGTTTQQNPSHIFTATGTYAVSETATDAAGQTCSYSQTVTVQKPIPSIKEVAPR